MKQIGKLPSKVEQESYARKTDYFAAGKFRNVNTFSLMQHKRSPKAVNRLPGYQIPVCKPGEIPPAEEGKLIVWWLGHSSVLLQMGKINILIDPVLRKYASPFSWVGVKRYSEIPIAPEMLPHIDYVLISHDHYDHLDYQTILAIQNKADKFLVPLGVEALLKSWGIAPDAISSLGWWESAAFADIRITATPSQHFSTRNPLRGNATWWCGFCIEDGAHSVYYSGDGGYWDNFEEIGKRFPGLDLALMECGQYDEAWPSCHMFPEETARAALEVGAKWCIPIHWGAFCLCNSAWNDSVKRILKKAPELNLCVATPQIGQRVDYDRIGEYTVPWWECEKGTVEK